jgi:CheY-like chemotaxis protein
LGRCEHRIEISHARTDDAVADVLVVEDEVLIRLVIADYLRECGYRVHEAANAAEAVAVLESGTVAIDIVFSDVLMPGDMDGFGLCALGAVAPAERPRHPDLERGAVRRHRRDLCEAGPLLEKPYEPHGVVDRIRQLIARSNAGPSARP